MPFLDRFEHQIAGDRDRPVDADAMGTVDGLVLHRRVPPAVEKEHVVDELQVQAHAAGAVAHQEHVLASVFAEALR